MGTHDQTANSGLAFHLWTSWVSRESLDPITNKRFFTPASIRNLIRLKIADCEQTAGWFYLQDIWNSLRIQIAYFIKRS
ncbi:hypothetical protein CQA65_00020 [Klebsiella pneumoniae]|nr:hypothetical protein CQA22_15370 [Klebsiella pneumoniae]PCR11298.1 hypothetical protein CQA67_30340 [Klebsiella pneumoniae]PCR21402.1 hypothetical protein CQA65_00020 [Klebsiella pneumoniae]